MGKSLAYEVGFFDEVEAEGEVEDGAELRCMDKKHVVDLGCPVYSDGSDLTLLKEQTLNDPSLKHFCRLAYSNSMGYSWKKGLLVHKLNGTILGARERLVLPKPRCPFILNIAHEQSGHFGARKVRSLLNKFYLARFARRC